MSASTTTIPKTTLADNGVWEAMRDAKQQGKVKFIGFTGHKDAADPPAHARPSR